MATLFDDDGAQQILVEDRGVCRSCGAVVQVSEDEPYCFECGAYLLEAEMPWPTLRLQHVVPGDPPDDAVLISWEEEVFAVRGPDPGTTTSRQAAAAPTFTRGVQLLTGLRSDVGILRAGSPDEDSVFALTLTGIYESKAQPTIGLYFVADGMGGHGDGEIASRIVSEVVSNLLLQTLILPLLQGQHFGDEMIGGLLDAAIQAANRRVVENARTRGNDMGTTLTLALLLDQHIYVANVGDSRTYLWSGGQLQQISEDHSVVFQLYRKGLLTEEEIYVHPRRNEIVRSLGFRADVQVDFFHEQLAPNDCLVLCCDGLWEMLHSDGIADVLLSNFGDPQAICDELIKRANQAGGDDNISVIVVRAQA